MDYRDILSDNVLKKIYIYLAAAWVLAFAVLTGLIMHNAAALSADKDRLNALADKIGADVKEAWAMSAEIGTTAEELAYLDKFAAIYPENKSYLRTQSAIADEVKELRKKIAQKINGRLHILVDTKANKLYFKRGTRLLWEADCSVGRGGTLKDKKTGKIWEFVTPRGEFHIIIKIDDPMWIKPDWAFVEAGEPVPPKDDESRKVKGELGKYAFDIGNGYLIHGTKNEAMLGEPVSHGCVRLGAEPLEKLFKTAPVGIKVYIY